MAVVSRYVRFSLCRLEETAFVPLTVNMHDAWLCLWYANFWILVNGVCDYVLSWCFWLKFKWNFMVYFPCFDALKFHVLKVQCILGIFWDTFAKTSKTWLIRNLILKSFLFIRLNWSEFLARISKNLNYCHNLPDNLIFWNNKFSNSTLRLSIDIIS